MKKSTLLAAALMACTAAHADEGMWTLYNLPQAVYAQMQTEGFSLPYSSLYSGENAIKNTVINFSGFCSGVVVSADEPSLRLQRYSEELFRGARLPEKRFRFPCLFRRTAV